MRKFFPIIIVSAMLLTGCANEFNQVYKTSDYSYKYEYAKECFMKGKYTRAVTLLQDLVTLQKGTDNAQEGLYMLAMAQYLGKDYESAAATFKKYYSSYPKGVYAEMAQYYIGQSLYMSTPEPRLDQSQTVAAISAFQDYLDLFPTQNIRRRHRTACSRCRTSWCRRSFIRLSSIMTSDNISATAQTAATTMRRAS